VPSKKKGSPAGRGVGQIKLDDSYVQQKRPVSMVSPSLKPVSPSLESSLCDRRQQLIQHRAKTFMGDSNSNNRYGYDNNRFINSSNNNNNNRFSPASLTTRPDFISGFTSAAAIVEAPKSARLPYFCSQPALPVQPDYQNDYYCDPRQPDLSLTLFETYAVNNPAYVPPTNPSYSNEYYSDPYAPIYFQATDRPNQEPEVNETRHRCRL
jgi:hypothetical protein